MPRYVRNVLVLTRPLRDLNDAYSVTRMVLWVLDGPVNVRPSLSRNLEVESVRYVLAMSTPSPLMRMLLVTWHVPIYGKMLAPRTYRVLQLRLLPVHTTSVRTAMDTASPTAGVTALCRRSIWDRSLGGHPTRTEGQ